MPGCLNSVIIEGDFIEGQKEEKDGVTAFSFRIKSVSWASFSGQKEKRTSIFLLRAYGKLAETCSTVLAKGRGIRAVGRLEVDAEGVYILAEHVEFKPVAKKSAEA